MKKLILTALTACIATTAYANCGYEQINSPEYKVDEITSKYMGSSFVLSEKTGTLSHSFNNKKYEEFANTNLKISRTAIPVKYTQERYKSKSENVEIGGKSYKRDQSVA
ncbi:hypothetical protein ACFBZI_00005, partial [Moraxella sp. ZJ142]